MSSQSSFGHFSFLSNRVLGCFGYVYGLSIDSLDIMPIKLKKKKKSVKTKLKALTLG